MRYVDLDDIARLPAPNDEAAVAVRDLPPGTQVRHRDGAFTIRSLVPEGHRFAVRTIRTGQSIHSWGWPFGVATRDILPGEHLCSPRVLEVLEEHGVRGVARQANFENQPIVPCQLDAIEMITDGRGAPARLYRADVPPTFMGYLREGGRGVGTRNYVVLLATNSRVAGVVQALERRTRHLGEGVAGLDGVVAVAHTEGGEDVPPNNLELLLRTLAGFIVHPNVGAVLCVDDGLGPLDNTLLRRYMEAHGYPLAHVPHVWLTVDADREEKMRLAEGEVRRILEGAAWRSERVRSSLEHLRLGLQCGGSDAFSGISANPLVGLVARELVAWGGSANLAETDELMGAEAHVLQRVRSRETAERFLEAIDRFKQLLAWHGHTPESNPSGGNVLRGLYNITLKSLGAAMKKPAEQQLDYVIDYAERMALPGYYFMDSPGNDLESVAGQVAAGCNMIAFTTGNGSVTNFPFVPTIKVVTTTRRYNLLSEEMDFNAGRYLDGEGMRELALEAFALLLRAASGERTKGERAGHSQVSIWRNWRQTQAVEPERVIKRLPHRPVVPGPAPSFRPDLTARLYRGPRGAAIERVGLVLPTSLCASQVARLAAERLQAQPSGREAISRFVSLPHTEGCGVSSGHSQELYTQLMINHLLHPAVSMALLLEHGCEKTHNGYMRLQLERLGIDPDAYGWASVQLDGGMRRVLDKIELWFRRQLEGCQPVEREDGSLAELCVGLWSDAVDGLLPSALASLACALAAAGARVVIPHTAPLAGEFSREPSLGFGVRAALSGIYVMEALSRDWSETLAGMVACGASLILACPTRRSVAGHPLVPVLQATHIPRLRRDVDAWLEGDSAKWPEELARLLSRAASGEYTSLVNRLGVLSFQVARGPLGVSV